MDRLVIDDKIRVRLGDSVETALRWGEGRLVALHQPDGAERRPPGRKRCIPIAITARRPGMSYEPLTPKHFSFNSPAGACPVCHGLGQKLVFDEGLIVPDPEKSLEQGAVLPWRRGGKRMVVYYKSLLRGLAQHYQQSLETPYKDRCRRISSRCSCTDRAETEIEFNFWRAGKIEPDDTRPFEGVIPNLERLYQESESEFTRNRLKGFMSPQFCDACGGRRLKPEILAVTIGDAAADRNRELQDPRPPTFPGLSIMDVCSLSVEAADEFFRGLKLTEFQQKIADEVIREIRARLGFLKNVGLGYLTLEPRERHVERRRGAAHPAGHANRRGAGGRALYS